MSNRFFLALLIAASSLAGCGSSSDKLYPVTGRVLLKDRKPVAGAIVEFSSLAGHGARARTNPDGTFTITSGGKPGALPGAYRVAVIQMLVIDGAGSHSKAHHAPLVLNPKYARFESSGLEYEVKPDRDNVYELILDSAAQR
ncbi:MAG: carboxypeptidase regulatory-like domain-containing protein [Planctomycetia bacterium]|nr:carboxypeptidase regulatory-like domain-containing protein [Planctomycetia bacterium]